MQRTKSRSRSCCGAFHSAALESGERSACRANEREGVGLGRVGVIERVDVKNRARWIVLLAAVLERETFTVEKEAYYERLVQKWSGRTEVRIVRTERYANSRGLKRCVKNISMTDSQLISIHLNHVPLSREPSGEAPENIPRSAR